MKRFTNLFLSLSQPRIKPHGCCMCYAITLLQFSYTGTHLTTKSKYLFTVLSEYSPDTSGMKELLLNVTNRACFFVSASSIMGVSIMRVNTPNTPSKHFFVYIEIFVHELLSITKTSTVQRNATSKARKRHGVGKSGPPVMDV